MTLHVFLFVRSLAYSRVKMVPLKLNVIMMILYYVGTGDVELLPSNHPKLFV